jgi:hypothetical protein
MIIFWQIFFANIILVFVLIGIHEVGHWVMGLIAGIPYRNMKIRMFTFPQQVFLRDEQDWVSVSNYERYHSILNKYVPTSKGKYLYVSGGFLFETIFLVIYSLILWKYDFWLYAAVASGLSLMMFLVYLFAMDIPQSKSLKKPWGDTTILFSLSQKPTILVVSVMILIRVVLAILFLIERT